MCIYILWHGYYPHTFPANSNRQRTKNLRQYKFLFGRKFLQKQSLKRAHCPQSGWCTYGEEREGDWKVSLWPNTEMFLGVTAEWWRVSKRTSGDRHLSRMASHYQGICNVTDGVAGNWANMLVYLVVECWLLWFVGNHGPIQIGTFLNDVAVAKSSPQDMFRVKLDGAWKVPGHCSSVKAWCSTVSHHKAGKVSFIPNGSQCNTAFWLTSFLNDDI